MLYRHLMNSVLVGREGIEPLLRTRAYKTRRVNQTFRPAYFLIKSLKSEIIKIGNQNKLATVQKIARNHGFLIELGSLTVISLSALIEIMNATHK